MIRLVKASVLADLREKAAGVADLQLRYDQAAWRLAEVEARSLQQVEAAKAEARIWRTAHETLAASVGTRKASSDGGA